MNWPVSVTKRTLPSGVPSTFPGIPANDNWRTPATNIPYRGPAPANDNVPRKPKGLKLPGVRRLLPVWSNALAIAEFAWRVQTYGDWVAVPNGPGIIIDRIGTDCGPGNATHRFPYGSLCQVPWHDTPPDTPPNMDEIVVPSWPSAAQWQMNEYVGEHSLPNYFVWKRVGQGYRARRESGSVTANRVSMQRAVNSRTQALPRPQVEPYPGFFPPLAQPMAGKADPVKPGSKSPKQTMPEGKDAGYGVKKVPRRGWNRSQRPPRKTRERKVRFKAHPLARALEFYVSLTTEALDFQHALFEALPFWRKMQLLNANRRLELLYDSGRIIKGRLHYVALTPTQKAQAIYDYINEIDVAKAMAKVVEDQIQDHLWATVGRGMGKFQRGPWDNHRTAGMIDDAEPEWDWYIPDVDPEGAHNHYTYESLVNSRLTRDEARRINTRFDQFRSQLYEPKWVL